MSRITEKQPGGQPCIRAAFLRLPFRERMPLLYPQQVRSMCMGIAAQQCGKGSSLFKIIGNHERRLTPVVFSTTGDSVDVTGLYDDGAEAVERLFDELKKAPELVVKQPVRLPGTEGRAGNPASWSEKPAPLSVDLNRSVCHAVKLPIGPSRDWMRYTIESPVHLCNHTDRFVDFCHHRNHVEDGERKCLERWLRKNVERSLGEILNLSDPAFPLKVENMSIGMKRWKFSLDPYIPYRPVIMSGTVLVKAYLLPFIGNQTVYGWGRVRHAGQA